ncbi:hypothetical protein RND81_07G060900 [Saponaria officinalis]|uniref:Acetylajmalan esterase-like n=1 Tax=Saponaria officinalis TaxID=3572 RepID=A0AAW1JKS4_SAPOF
MATTFFTVAALLFCCFAKVCLSHTLADENPIRLVSDRSSANYNLAHPYISRDFGVNAIYQFGDSISDTGNLIRVDPSNSCGKWPYGETFFQKPTGRCSDGLLMIDYFAEFLNIAMLDPYLNKDGNFTHGVNFAVSGSTAVNVSTLEETYSLPTPTNLSLSVQLEWFKSHIQYFYPNISERRNKLAKGLFFMGEIGGNDIFFAFSKGITLPNIHNIMSLVIQAIRKAVEEIIDIGATQIVIPGNFPIGCMPIFLTLFKTNDSNMYDEIKCLKEYNGHAQFYNDQLQQTIIELQKNHSDVTIVYMDYFGVLQEILQHAALLGFDENALEQACCGASDNEYNVNMDSSCGSEGVTVCENPRDHISWDGLHFTQQTYHIMAKKLVPSLLGALRNVAYT